MAFFFFFWSTVLEVTGWSQLKSFLQQDITLIGVGVAVAQCAVRSVKRRWLVQCAGKRRVIQRSGKSCAKGTGRDCSAPFQENCNGKNLKKIHNGESRHWKKARRCQDAPSSSYAMAIPFLPFPALATGVSPSFCSKPFQLRCDRKDAE